MARRIFLAFIVALLLVGQHAMFAHAMTHLRADSRQDKTLPDKFECQKCSFFAKFSSVAPGIAALPVPPQSIEVAPSRAAKPFFYLASRPYYSRAPPIRRLA